jgi:hypothetical protein
VRIDSAAILIFFLFENYEHSTISCCHSEDVLCVGVREERCCCRGPENRRIIPAIRTADTFFSGKMKFGIKSNTVDATAICDLDKIMIQSMK